MIGNANYCTWCIYKYNLRLNYLCFHFQTYFFTILFNDFYLKSTNSAFITTDALEEKEKFGPSLFKSGLELFCIKKGRCRWYLKLNFFLSMYRKREREKEKRAKPMRSSRKVEKDIFIAVYSPEWEVPSCWRAFPRDNSCNFMVCWMRVERRL